MTASDCIWYPGVAANLFASVVRGARVYSSCPGYTHKPGTYRYPDGEGEFTVEEVDGRLYVHNQPHDNDVSSWKFVEGKR